MVAIEELKRRQVEMETSEKKLIHDCKTSTFYTLEHLIEMRWPTAVLSNEQVTKRSDHYLDLKSEQWVFAEELVNVLGPFEVTTTFHSYEENPSISVLLVLLGMVKNLSDDSPTIAQLKQVSREITWRWELECLDTSFIICSGGSSFQATKLPQ